MRSETIDVETAVWQLIGHHRRGREVGEVSDGEIALAVELLTAHDERERALSLVKSYILGYRRARHPLAYEILLALGPARDEFEGLLSQRGEVAEC
jgi:hypothetical protein